VVEAFSEAAETNNIACITLTNISENGTSYDWCINRSLEKHVKQLRYFLKLKICQALSVFKREENG